MQQNRLLIKAKSKNWCRRSAPSTSTNPEVAEKIRTEAEYFQTNAERMRYPKFRGQHLFVGSGVIEAGCKTVIGSRLKRSGMFWTVRGPMPSWRCAAANSTPVRRLLGGAPGGLTSTSMSRTLNGWC